MKKFLTNPAFAYSAAAVIIIATSVYAYAASKQKPVYNYATVKSGSITQTVSVDGMVAAAQDVPLEFQLGGTITEIDAKVGASVSKGQVIAKIDTKSANAAIASASAAVQSAKANYEKVVAGASSPQIDVAKAAVENAQVTLNNATKNLTVVTSQQQTAVLNAQSAMLNAGLAATPSASNSSSSSVQPTVTGTYTGTQLGSYTVTLYASGNGMNYQYSGLESGSGIVTPNVPLALGKMGLFITFPNIVNLQSTSSWTVSIPNAQSPAYLAASNAYQTALQTQNQAVTSAQEAISSAQAALDSANAQLTAVVTPARSEDIDSAEAAVNAASAQLQAAENILSNSIITAPFDGQIGTMPVEVGTTVTASQPIGTIITSNKYEVDVQLSQSQIAKVKVGDPANITFDAYLNQQFAATLTSVDTAATMEQGNAVYDATLQFDQEDSRIQSGLNANVNILDETHNNTLTVPATSIITKNDQKFVLVKGSGNTTSQVQVTTGIENSDMVEILSGLQAGQQVATF
jgi:RND family efflux transporter MFP subunit